MQLKYRQLAFSLILIFLSACTDSRTRQAMLQFGGGRSGIPGLTAVSSVHFDGKITSTSQMVTRGGSLFLSGRPFGLSHWNIGTNPSSPFVLFAYSDNIQAFSGMGGWTPDYYAGGAIGLKDNYALTSGTAGASLIDISNPNAFFEIDRYPRRTGAETGVPSDTRFQYKAILAHPTQPYFYGFTSNYGVYLLRLGTQGISLVSETPTSYPSQAGYVQGGVLFNQKAYVAATSQLLQFEVTANGTLGTSVQTFSNFNATNVVASSNYLFVQHQAISGNTYSSGVYICEPSSNGLTAKFFIPSFLPVRFAVSADSNYLYANLDDDSVYIFKIDWNNIPRLQ